MYYKYYIYEYIYFYKYYIYVVYIIYILCCLYILYIIYHILYNIYVFMNYIYMLYYIYIIIVIIIIIVYIYMCVFIYLYICASAHLHTTVNEYEHKHMLHKHGALVVEIADDLRLILAVRDPLAGSHSPSLSSVLCCAGVPLGRSQAVFSISIGKPGSNVQKAHKLRDPRKEQQALQRILQATSAIYHAWPLNNIKHMRPKHSEV